MQFIKRVLDVPLGYSKVDLITFRSVASRDYIALVPVIDEYIRLAEQADTDVIPRSAGNLSKRFTEVKPRLPGVSSLRSKASLNVEQMHLFDLLRDRKLFPSNSDLSDFAARVLPSLTRKRFDKMSRGEIVAKIIEYVETRDAKTRRDLEASMRDAMLAVPDTSDRRSFFSKWEKIIKGSAL
jgi:hypothetical protein